MTKNEGGKQGIVILGTDDGSAPIVGGVWASETSDSHFKRQPFLKSLRVFLLKATLGNGT